MAPLETLSPVARRWFDAHFDAPTDVQREGWSRIAAGDHALLIAPTGSGKTLAAFLSCIDRLGARPAAEREPGVRVLYVSPLKALVVDIERNLRAPLVGLERVAGTLGAPFEAPRVAVRTGDTPARERRAQTRNPAEILVTTPESLYLILGSEQRETLRRVETIIVDEIHALAATKRGAHLALCLERVCADLAVEDAQRIGLSATARPLDEIGRFLGGDRPVAIVDTSARPSLDIEIRVPVPDMTRPDRIAAPAPTGDTPGAPAADDAGVSFAAPEGSLLRDLAARDDAEQGQSLWPAIYPELLADIRAHQSTIVFTNSRGLCERLAQRLNELAEEEIARAHHGSIAHETRREIEDALKTGALQCIVATSSLELGIDMGAVDLVLMVESPGAVSRGLQRIGRAGHQVGEASRGRIYPKHRSDLLEAAVVAREMREGAVEAIRLPRNPLDVLAQQVVAMAALRPWRVDEIEALVRRCANYRDLSREALLGVLEMLAGRYPSTDFAELRPRVNWDRERDLIEGRRGAKQLALLSGGTIPDRGLYAVHLGPEGPRVGELDEEMVHESRAGETLTLGASTWRIVEITRDRVVVTPAPGEIGKLPFWRGEGPGRPLELGRALGRFTRELLERSGAREPAGLESVRSAAEEWLRREADLDTWAARNLVGYLVEQIDATGTLPDDRTIVVERFRDELGDWRICLMTPFGSRLHAPWALAIEARLSQSAGYQVQTLWSDDGIVLRFADAEDLPPLEVLLPEPEEVEEQVVTQLANSALFAGQFRENAARALLLPRRRPGSRTPLWAQRLRAQNLLAVAREFPSFPMMLETYRACLQDVFDLPGLREVLEGIRRRDIRVCEAETRSASPFACSLVFAYTAVYLYQGDTPVAERRAQALTLDRSMLRDLLGTEELRDLLDADVIATTESELQGLAEEFRARHPDALHDLLRRVGDLGEAEVAARCEGDAQPWLESLAGVRRAIRVSIAGEQRWIAAEDAGLYRDALGVVPPVGVPEVFLEAGVEPLHQIVSRYARTHGPFLTREVAERLGLVPAQVAPVLEALAARGKLQSGDFHPHGIEREWCEPEVLRRLRRRTLAKLRGEVAPVEARTLARFLPRWHGIPASGAGEGRLREALEQLEGVALPFSELERSILPARVADFDPRMLDELGALGQFVWVGRGALGERDGRVAIYRRDRFAQLTRHLATPSGEGDAPSTEASEFDPDAARGPVHQAVLGQLRDRGASFFSEIRDAAGAASVAEVLDALWDLVWQGELTNDTFAPLRALAQRRDPRSRRGAPSAAAGRWSRVSSLVPERAEPSAGAATASAHALALTLLERYGVVSREVMRNEGLRGGMSAVYPILREMEEAGKVRRGHFVDALQGAQFAFAGAVDRLRAERSAEPEEPILLAAVDPAQPYGALLPWPETCADGAKPRRATGALVVLVDGRAVLFVDRGGNRVLRFKLDAGEPEREIYARAAATLGARYSSPKRRSLRIEWIDDRAADVSPEREIFLAAGFRAEYKSLVYDRFGGGDPRHSVH